MSRISAPLGFIEPQLLTSVDQPPQGDEWLHEVKHDGYRPLIVVEGGQTRAYTRTGLGVNYVLKLLHLELWHER